jgi:ferredoxin
MEGSRDQAPREPLGPASEASLAQPKAEREALAAAEETILSQPSPHSEPSPALGTPSERCPGTTSPEPVEGAAVMASTRIVIESQEGSVSIEGPIGGTVLEAVQRAGLARGEPVDWECGDGGCGVCVLGVIEGADRLDPPDPETGEMKTIQITEQVVPDPKKYRLACLARVRGPVRLRRLS